MIKNFIIILKKGHQYLASTYDGFKTYNEAEFEGNQKIDKIMKNGF